MFRDAAKAKPKPDANLKTSFERNERLVIRWAYGRTVEFTQHTHCKLSRLANTSIIKDTKAELKAGKAIKS